MFNPFKINYKVCRYVGDRKITELKFWLERNAIKKRDEYWIAIKDNEYTDFDSVALECVKYNSESKETYYI